METIKSYANIIIIIIVLSIGGFAYWKISSTISGLKDQLVVEKAETKKYLDKYNESQRDIAIEHANVINLNNKLDIINLKSKELEDSINIKVKELDDWKNKPPEVKYTEKVKNIIVNKGYDSKECSEGLKLMESISKLKYEEL